MNSKITHQDIIEKYTSVFGINDFEFISGYGNAIVGVAEKRVCYSMKRIIEISMDNFGFTFGSACMKVDEFMEKYPKHIFVDDILGTI